MFGRTYVARRVNGSTYQRTENGEPTNASSPFSAYIPLRGITPREGGLAWRDGD